MTKTEASHRSPGFFALCAFVWLLSAYHGIFGFFFPLPNGLMGHDYAQNITAYLDGYYWYKNNGFMHVPWFTPSFCGGQVFFGDPQSSFYAIPQFLTFFHLDPLNAVYVSVLMFASAGYWGMYWLARRTFSLSEQAAIVAAALFMFNGFFAARMIVGHITFQGVMLVPAIAALVLQGQAATRTSWAPAVLGGLLIAYCLQSGLTSLMVPAALSVLVIAVLFSLLRRMDWRVFFRLSLSALALATALCASKLVASLTLMGHFPRTEYALPGFEGFPAIAKVLFQSLFASSQSTYLSATPLWHNLQWAQAPHELAFGMTPIPIVIVAAALAYRMWQVAQSSDTFRLAQWRCSAADIGRIVILTGILAIPVALLYFTPDWNAFLKQLPLIGATSAPIRWSLLYLPLIALLAALAADIEPRLAGLCCLATVIGVPLVNGLEDRSYYYTQNFDPAPVLTQYRAISVTGTVPPITENIVFPASTHHRARDPNSQFVYGESSLNCYNSLFGYRLEHLQVAPLTTGPVLSSPAPGLLNIHNPACLLYPKENHCRPWDSFTTAQYTQAFAFTHYQPYVFSRSQTQSTADWVTQASLAALLLYAVAMALSLVRKRRAPHTTS